MKQKYIDLFESNLNSAIDLWLTRSPDREHGGIYHCLDRDGNIFSRDKGVWMQGRAGWTFSYLYNHYQPRPEFLEIAKSCIDFAREKCTDTDGRMYVKVTKDGAPLEKSGEWFSEAFYIMACACRNKQRRKQIFRFSGGACRRGRRHRGAPCRRFGYGYGNLCLDLSIQKPIQQQADL